MLATFVMPVAQSLGATSGSMGNPVAKDFQHFPRMPLILFERKGSGVYPGHDTAHEESPVWFKIPYKKASA